MPDPRHPGQPLWLKRLTRRVGPSSSPPPRGLSARVTVAHAGGALAPRWGCQRPWGGTNASRTALRNTRTGNRGTLARSEDHIDESSEFGKNVCAGGKPECRRLELQQGKRKQRRNRGNSGPWGNGRSWHGRRRKWHRNGRIQYRNGRIQYRSRRIQHRNRRHDDSATRRFRD